MKKARLHVLACLLLFSAPLLFFGGINFIVDPLQIYRQHATSSYFWVNQRNQNAGKIRNYLLNDNYSAIIVGSSIADCFIPSQVSKKLGWGKTLKLTVSGGRATEQAFMLEKATKEAKISHVLWAISPLVFSGNEVKNWHEERRIPQYLYTDTIFDDGQYLFSLDIFQLSIAFLEQRKPNRRWRSDLNKLNYWMKGKIKSYVKFNSLANFQKLMRNWPVVTKQVSVQNQKSFPSAEYNIIEQIKNNPETEFIIVFAPMHRRVIAMMNSDKLSIYFSVQRYIVEKTQSLKNVRVYGFEDDDLVAGNLANFRDSQHYHSGVNQYMVDAIVNEGGRLTIHNIDKYFDNIVSKINSRVMTSDFDTAIPMALGSENRKLKRMLKRSANGTKSGSNDGT
jgi:hypothetical protein